MGSLVEVQKCMELRQDSVSGLVQDLSRHLADRLIRYYREWDSGGSRLTNLKVWMRIEYDSLVRGRGAGEGDVVWKALCDTAAQRCRLCLCFTFFA